MGIYVSGIIFGIKIYYYTEEDVYTVLFEEKYDEKMTVSQMREAYLFYEGLTNKNEIHFQYYTEHSSTYGDGTYSNWCPMSLNLFLEKFGI